MKNASDNSDYWLQVMGVLDGSIFVKYTLLFHSEWQLESSGMFGEETKSCCILNSFTGPIEVLLRFLIW